ncbi:MAG: cupin domain-containing protein [Saprospiraceae bacterium]
MHSSIHPDTQAIIDHYQFDRIPIEGTFYKSTYRSTKLFETGAPLGTAIIAMYSEQPLSISCFHRLPHDEIWHFYGGDPLILYLLYEDGTTAEVVMGANPLKGQQVQFVVPANTWQAGEMLPGGRYSLFGCTMAPGFIGADFEAGTAAELIKAYPDKKKEIIRLSVNGHQTRMPEGYEG